MPDSPAVNLPGTGAVDVVCWDWNGTLLDDSAVALVAMNTVLREQGLPVVPHLDAYREAFGFPVQTFYARMGITGTNFRPAAALYLETFAARVGEASLHAGAREVLTGIGRLGVRQVLISATVLDVLHRQLAPHAITAHFDQVLGITDAYAASKADVVATWLRSSGHDPARVLMVGDTNHDEEIAEELSLSFVRFARGHQKPPAHDRHPVVSHLHEVRTGLGHIEARTAAAGLEEGLHTPPTVRR